MSKNFLLKTDSEIVVDDNDKITTTFHVQEDVNNAKIIVGKNSQIILNFLLIGEAKNINFKLTVDKNTIIKVNFADLSNGNCDVNCVFDLIGENTEIDWQLAALTENNDQKTYSISFNHLSAFTKAKMNNYGVAKNNSHLCFSGVSKIFHNARGSETSQNAKILVFDKNVIAKANPILKIDENDVKASHSATVGMVNEEHLFYLTSRGLTKNDAEELITMGYLRPIAKMFDENDKRIILKRIGMGL